MAKITMTTEELLLIMMNGDHESVREIKAKAQDTLINSWLSALGDIYRENKAKAKGE